MHTEFCKLKKIKLIIKLILGNMILRLLNKLNLFRIEFIDMLLW
jgi:hypothetical protein